MTEVEDLATFVCSRKLQDLSPEARLQLKIRILDSLGCAFGALKADPIHLIRKYIDEFGGKPLSSLIGGGATTPERAAFYNGALVRYLDYNDSYLAKGETCHPSDNLAPILAAAEYADCKGEDLLVALAIAYQIQCRLSDVAPVRAKGFDHTVQGAYAVAAGVAKALGLNPQQTAHAIAISGTANLALRVARTGPLSHWKGLASPNTALMGTHAAYLARQGITGPLTIFEGNKGFKDLAGPFTIDWHKEDLERVNLTIIKKYNAEIHSQAVIEGIFELQKKYEFKGSDVASVDIEIFDVAYHIIGGGEEGNKTTVRTKEEADHSLPYLVAVALLDQQVLPAQYDPDRIVKEDVQDLLQRVTIKPNPTYSNRFPEQMACLIRVHIKDGLSYEIEKHDYEGFYSHPMSWDSVIEKFYQLSLNTTTANQRSKIIEAVTNLQKLRVRDLAFLINQRGDHD